LRNGSREQQVASRGAILLTRRPDFEVATVLVTHSVACLDFGMHENHQQDGNMGGSQFLGRRTGHHQISSIPFENRCPNDGLSDAEGLFGTFYSTTTVPVILGSSLQQ